MKDKPILIAGPTASGKSALAMALAAETGGIVLNADALQVYDGWRVLTARPSPADEAALPHGLYGHVGMSTAYSVGAWLRDLAPYLDPGGPRPIIVGGTGLYLSALTEGLAPIPPIEAGIRQEGDAIRENEGVAGFIARLKTHDPEILARIDLQNPARLQRAWEVWAGTGRPLSSWQANTGAALLPLSACHGLVLAADRDWLAARIERRFGAMVEGGALDEVAAAMEAGIDWAAPSARALGAAELRDYLTGRITKEAAAAAATIATRQFAKRQRTWFRTRMRHWAKISVSKDTAADLVATAMRLTSMR